MVASLHQLPHDKQIGAVEGNEDVAATTPSVAPAAAVSHDNNDGRKLTTSRTKGQVRADLAAVARLRMRMFFTPGVFRELAKEALLAEGRAFERYSAADSEHRNAQQKVCDPYLD